MRDKLVELEDQLHALTVGQSDTTLHRNYHASSAPSDEPLQYVLERVARNENTTASSFKSLGSRLDQLTEALSTSHAMAERQGHADAHGDERYDSIEKALNSVVGYIEQSDTALRVNIDELRGNLTDLAGEVATAPKGADQASRKILGEIENQLTALGHRVDQMNDGKSNGLAEDIEQRLIHLIDRIEGTEQRTESSVSELHGHLERRITGLNDRLDSVASHSESAAAEAAAVAVSSTRDDVRTVESQLEELARQIQDASQPAEETAQSLSHLSTEVSALTGDIELIKHHAASERDLNALSEVVGGLKQTVEQKFADACNDTAFADLEKRLNNVSAELGSALDQRIGEVTNKIAAKIDSQTPDPALEIIERKVHELDARLAANQDGGGSDQLVQAVEEQISGLGKRLNAAEQRYSGIQAIEKSIAQLFESVEQTRNWANEAADRAAKRMVEQLQADGSNGETASSTVIALEQGLAGIKASAETADQRTQETLEAVHETLEKVVMRIVALENNAPLSASAGSANAGMATPAPAPAYAGAELPPVNSTDEMPVTAPKTEEPSWRAAIDAKAAQEMEEILAGGAPQSNNKAPEATSLAAGEPFTPSPMPSGSPALNAAPDLSAADNDPANRRNDFIAAARRAAQAASDEPQADSGRSRFQLLRRNKKAAEAASGAVEDAGDGTTSKKRRPLILAAIVLLLIGAASAYNFLGNKSSTTTSDLSVPPVSELAVPSQLDEPAMLEMPPLLSDVPSESLPEIAPLETTLPPGPGTQSSEADTEMVPLQPSEEIVATLEPVPSDPITTGSINPIPEETENVTHFTVDPLLNDGGLEGFNLNTDMGDEQIVDRSGRGDSDASLTANIDPDDLPAPGVGSMDLRVAAASGDATAQFLVATAYTDGNGVAQDYRLAAMWYQRAAARGLAPAQYRLATFYEKGRGVPEDLAAARIWYERAAENGNRKAMHNLAVIYADGSRGTPNFTSAALWFRNAAELGLRDSQYNLAILHERGLGVEESMIDAYRWFALAANQGDQDAASRISVIEGRLTAQELLQTKVDVENWRAKPMIEAANTVTEPSNGWAGRAGSAQANASATQDMVREVQTLLNQLGYSAGTPDGIMGSRTRDAISSFQGANEMDSSGAITPALLERLRSRTS